MSEAEPLRLFVAVLPPPAVREAVAAAQAALRRPEVAVRWVAPEGVHLTLQFLGATPSARLPVLTAALAGAAAAGRPLGLRTAGLGIFPGAGPRARVVWLGLAGEVGLLAALQAGVTAATGPLGFPAEARPFTPHLTLGRVRDEADAPARQALARAVQAAMAPAPAAWPVDDVALMRSVLGRGGAVYTVVARWRLGAPAEG